MRRSGSSGGFRLGRRTRLLLLRLVIGAFVLHDQFRDAPAGLAIALGLQVRTIVKMQATKQWGRRIGTQIRTRGLNTGTHGEHARHAKAASQPQHASQIATSATQRTAAPRWFCVDRRDALRAALRARAASAAASIAASSSFLRAAMKAKRHIVGRRRKNESTGDNRKPASASKHTRKQPGAA